MIEKLKRILFAAFTLSLLLVFPAAAANPIWEYVVQPGNKNLGAISSDSQISIQDDKINALAKLRIKNWTNPNEHAVLEYYDEALAKWVASDVALIMAETEVIDDTTSIYTITAPKISASHNVIDSKLRIIAGTDMMSEEFTITCTYNDIETRFVTHPANKNYGHRAPDEMLSLNYDNGRVGVVSTKVGITMEYYDTVTQEWIESSAVFTLQKNNFRYYIMCEDFPASSVFLNHDVRLKTSDGKYSNVFYLACNVYKDHPLPAATDGMNATQVLGFNTGDPIYLVPNVMDDSLGEITEVRWQVSTNQGKSYTSLGSILLKDSPNLVYKIDNATCSMTGNYYRYALNNNAGGELTYSEPYEIIVYENFEMKGTELVIKNTGGESTNDYGINSRLKDMVPWKNNLKNITKVTFPEQITKIGNNFCANMTSLKEIVMPKVTEIGEEVFAGDISLTYMDFPHTFKKLGKDAFKGCTGLLEVVFRNPDTVIDSSKDTIPLNFEDKKAPQALPKYQDMVAKMHRYPIIYGYQGIATDKENGIEKQTAGSTAFTYAQNNNVGFLPLGVITSTGKEYPIHWQYTVDGNEITEIIVSEKDRTLLDDPDGIDLYFPNSIHGHKVTTITEIDYYKKDPNYQPKEVLTCDVTDPGHVHGEECYSEVSIIDALGNYHNEGRNIVINNLYIPESVKFVNMMAFESATLVKNIYAFSKAKQDVKTSFVVDMDESKEQKYTIYSYSSNPGFRVSSLNYNYVVLDSELFSGVTGDLMWSVNLGEKSLTFSGSGRTANYSSAADTPYAWASNEIQSIHIESKVTGIGAYACAGFPRLNKIYNHSEKLDSVAMNAFDKSGVEWAYGNKLVKTCVNNPLYHAIETVNQTYTVSDDTKVQLTQKKDELEELNIVLMSLNEQLDMSPTAQLEKEIAETEIKIEKTKKEIERLERAINDLKFKFIFSDTTAFCGAGVKFTYNAADMSLTISGDGVMNQFYSPKDAPWYAASTFIRKVIINPEVQSLSNYAFHGITHLQEVYNYGKNQTIVGGNSSIFDIIKRRAEYANTGTAGYITVPELVGSGEAAYKEQIRQTLGSAKIANFNITEEDIRGKVLSCGKEAHSHNEMVCYKDGQITCKKEEHIHTDSCYKQSGTAIVLKPGTYVISRNANTQQILDIISGKAPDLTAEDYEVPVFAFVDENTSFSQGVPPRTDGYYLQNIAKESGKCGDRLTYYISQDNTLMIAGDGAMWDFKEGETPWKTLAKEVRAVKFPEKITSIGDFAFEGFSAIIDFGEIPDSISTIGKCAFKDCTSLHNFNIKNTIHQIGEGIFAGCKELRIVKTDNPNYYVIDGYFMNKNGTLLGFLRESLYANPEDKSLYQNDINHRVPSTIRIIGAYAYYKCESFTSLVIQDSVSEIREKAFAEIQGLQNIDSLSRTKQTIDASILEGSGILYDITDPKKYVILYKANSDFAIVGKTQEYTVKFHDFTDLSHIVAAYTGNPVMIGKTFSKDDVTISMVYKDGNSETISGNDPRMVFEDVVVKKIGDNVFRATYNDGFGQVIKTNEFIVPGTDGVNEIQFLYTGNYVWYGDELSRDYLFAKISSASGSMKTIDGNATYMAAGGNRFCITLEKNIADKAGEIEFKATYQDGQSGSLSGSFKVNCLNYITGLDAQYAGAPVEMAAGVNGISLDDLEITITWADGTTERIDGNDPRISILPNYQITGNHMIFEYTLTEGNRYDKVGSFLCNYDASLESVDFAYVGGAITDGTPFSFKDIQLTLHYADGKTQKIIGDTVVGLKADDMIIHTPDGLEEVNLTYTVGTNEFKGTVYIPGKVRTPVKLIVVKRPKKTVYQEGDVFDPTGMVVNCVFNNGLTQDVTEVIQIDGGDVITNETKYLTLIYEDTSSGYVVQTNLQLNTNQYQKQVTLEKMFKEQYEISKILFRSKKTEDNADLEDTDANADGTVDEAEQNVGKWQDITPLLNNSSYDDEHAPTDENGNSLYVPPIIKAGYGFELKVFTKYRTNRAGTEYVAFMKKAQWDTHFQTLHPDVDLNTFQTRWKYLNDVYPQAAPTANPDVMFFRTMNTGLIEADGTPIKNLVGADGKATDFLVMEKTNLSETNQILDEGEWYNSTKVFEFPVRAIVNGEETRRVYVSKDAADPDKKFTEYEIQIVSPAWFGYDPEPYFAENKFHYSTDRGETYANKSYAYNDADTKTLHVCASITIKVAHNDDLHTHILE